VILLGQYDSLYVRRVGVSLGVLRFEYEHDTRSVFGDFDSMRQTNRVGRIRRRCSSQRCEARPEIRATFPAEAVLPRVV
jgi:hypothetical protein